MRRLGDLWENGDDEERAFVAKLLRKLAYDGFIWQKTWREADEIWQRIVQVFVDLQKPYPEVAAMFLITTWMSGDPGPQGLGPLVDPD